MQPVLSTGWLKPTCDRPDERWHLCHIVCLDERHLPQVMALQEIIRRHLQRPDLLQTFSKEFMRRHMGPSGVVLGVFVQNRLVAFRNLYYPSPRDRQWNLGFDLGINTSELAHVVNLQMVCVHPMYRGNRLALKMNRIALNLLRARNTHLHACATVSPYNIWNIPVLLTSGFHIAKLKIKYGDKIRYIVYQHLNKTQAYCNGSSLEVNLNDLDTQKHLLDSGFCGVQLKQKQPNWKKNDASGFNVIFKWPLAYANQSENPRIGSTKNLPQQAGTANPSG